MSLEGGEVAVRLAGTGAKELALLLYSILKDQKKTKGKTRLTSMLRSGKELKVFAVSDTDLTQFCKEAKRYGVLYCVLKNRDATDGLTDVMVRAEDASKINRIFERFQLSKVDMASIKKDIERSRAEKSENPKPTQEHPAQEQASQEQAAPETGEPAQDMEAFIKELFKADPEVEGQTPNPIEGRTSKSRQSEPTLKPKTPAEQGVTDDGPVLSKPSVRKELAQIKEDLKKKAAEVKEPEQAPTLHRAPPKKKNKIKSPKGRER
jgi:hypothetical protein